jgi:hypothetical protein
VTTGMFPQELVIEFKEPVTVRSICIRSRGLQMLRIAHSRSWFFNDLCLLEYDADPAEGGGAGAGSGAVQQKEFSVEEFSAKRLKLVVERSFADFCSIVSLRLRTANDDHTYSTRGLSRKEKEESSSEQAMASMTTARPATSRRKPNRSKKPSLKDLLLNAEPIEPHSTPSTSRGAAQAKARASPSRGAAKGPLGKGPLGKGLFNQGSPEGVGQPPAAKAKVVNPDSLGGGRFGAAPSPAAAGRASLSPPPSPEKVVVVEKDSAGSANTAAPKPKPQAPRLNLDAVRQQGRQAPEGVPEGGAGDSAAGGGQGENKNRNSNAGPSAAGGWDKWRQGLQSARRNGQGAAQGAGA